MPNYGDIAFKWDLYTYPWRPNTDFIDLIKSSFSLKSKPLILGSTKEFRDLYVDQKVYLCDNSKKMLEINDVGNKKESIIHENWFDLYGGDYDLIIGDLILLMFDYDKKVELINVLKDNLSKKGKILLRCVVKNENNNIERDFIKNTLLNSKNLNYFYNLISFELVNAFGYNGSDLNNLFFNQSKDLSVKFSRDFLIYTPYNSGGNECLSKMQFLDLKNEFKFNILKQKDFNYVSEYIIEI